MALGVSAPAPTLGDAHRIYYATGTLGSGASVAVELAAATIEGINDGDMLISIVRFQRLTGAENINIGTHSTTATIASGFPHYLASTATALYYSVCNIIRTGSTNMSVMQYDSTPTYAVQSNGTNWGDMSTSKVVYLNALRQAASTYSWTWSIYRIGNNVK